MERAFPHLRPSQWEFALRTATKVIFDVSAPVEVRSVVVQSLAAYLRRVWPRLKEDPAFHAMHRDTLRSLIDKRDAQSFAKLASSLPLPVEDRDVLQPAAKEKAWAIVSSALPHMTGANLNFLGIKADDSWTVSRCMAGEQTRLEYLNLNDNKTLGSEDIGVQALCPPGPQLRGFIREPPRSLGNPSVQILF
jgi:hypothetical protein